MIGFLFTFHDNVISFQLNKFVTVVVSLIGGEITTDCPSCDLRYQLHADGPTEDECPHERIAMMFVSMQRADHLGIEMPHTGTFPTVNLYCF